MQIQKTENLHYITQGKWKTHTITHMCRSRKQKTCITLLKENGKLTRSLIHVDAENGKRALLYVRLMENSQD